VDFYRNWADYEAGFGHNTGEFWIGESHSHHWAMNRQFATLEIL